MADPSLQLHDTPGLRAGGLLAALGVGCLASALGCVSTESPRYSAEVVPRVTVPQPVMQPTVAVAPPLPRIPSNYTPSLRPDLPAGDLSRWWVAFGNDSLTQVIGGVLAENKAIHPQSLGSQSLHGSAEVAGNIAAAFFDKVLATSRLELVEQQLQYAASVSQAADTRYRAGEVGRADVLLSKAEIKRLQAKRAEYKKEWAVCEQYFRSLVGFQHDPGSVVKASDLRFSNPMLIDVGQPQSLLERRSDLLQARAQFLSLRQTGNNFHAVFAETANQYQSLVDQAFSEVNAALESIEPGRQQIEMLTQAETHQRQAFELLLDQYKSDRVNIAELISVQVRWFAVAEQLITAEHRHSRDFVALYVAAGGRNSMEPPHSSASYFPEPNRAGQDFLPPLQANYSNNTYSLGRPISEAHELTHIQLLPPIEKVDNIGSGTLTIVSLGVPKPKPDVRSKATTSRPPRRHSRQP